MDIQSYPYWWVLSFQMPLMTQAMKMISIKMKDNDVEIFFPQKIMIEYSHGIFKTVRRALYPGYAFIKSSKNNLTTLLENRPRGFRDFVRSGHELIPLHENEIVWLKNITDNDGVVGISKARQINQSIEIVSGPLQGKEAQIIGYSKRKKRAKLEVSLGMKKLNLELACLIHS